jgi:hypothetical protein
MSRLATPVQRRSRCAAASANFDDSYQINPDLSIVKCYYNNISSLQDREGYKFDAN